MVRLPAASTGVGEALICVVAANFVSKSSTMIIEIECDRRLSGVELKLCGKWIRESESDAKVSKKTDGAPCNANCVIV